MECCGELPTIQFAYKISLGSCDAHLCMSHTLQSALDSAQEARIVQIDFSAAFDRVNYQGILYNLCYVGIGGSVLFILTQILSNRSQHVMVDGCRSKLFNVVPGVPQGSVWGPLLFLQYTSELFYILKNRLISYADDSTLMAVVPSPDIRVTVAESMIRDFDRFSGWSTFGNEIECEQDKDYDTLQVTHNASPVAPLRSVVTRRTILMVLYLDRICQRGSQSVIFIEHGHLFRHGAISFNKPTNIIIIGPKCYLLGDQNYDIEQNV